MKKNGGQSIHPASWDLMASGSYNNNTKTPPYLSMTERELLSWATPTILSTDSPATLYPLCDSNKAYKINLSTNEYLMLEYRNNKKWDTYTRAKGMIVFHGDHNRITNWQSLGNTINVTPTNRGYYIEPASGDSTNIVSSSTSYPGSDNITSKNTFHLTNGTPVSRYINNIHYNADSSISINYINNAPTFTLNVSNITNTSALVTGSIAGTNITNKTLEYKTLSATNYTSIPLTSGTISTTLSNLTSNTNYVCRLTATINSVVYYSETTPFHTTCYNGAITSFPWNDGFENGIDCWNQEYVLGSVSWQEGTLYADNYTQPAAGSKFAYFYVQQSGSNTQTKLISPILDITSLQSPYLSFKHIQKQWEPDQDSLRVYYRTSETSQWVKLMSFSNDISNWQKDSIALPYASNTYQIAFNAYGNYGYGVGIDEVKVYNNQTTTQSCDAPTNLAATNITQTSANITWTAQEGQSSWQIKLGTNGSIINTSMPHYTFSGLTAGTSYTVYVRTNCTSSYSSWVNTTFTTQTVVLPQVITDSSSNITTNSAKLYGTIIAGNQTMTSKGFVFRKNVVTNGTIKTVTGSSDNITTTLSNLSPNTTYLYKAFVSNSRYCNIWG
ncbi:MAG: fibronectin type III domain-containing protein [Bacteroidales bacterium]|jgi:hypothetical protein|nr:fibronectin type III domain-containing protein [Bacteroidales bacterium]